jgi:nucleoid-associated protein YgaU
MESENRGRGVLDRLKQAFGGSGRAQAKPARASGERADFSDVQAGSSSTAPAPGPEEPAEKIHAVASGESLSKIAKRYYGDANAWRRIYEANRQLIGDNPDLIHPGQRLRIPQP